MEQKSALVGESSLSPPAPIVHGCEEGSFKRTKVFPANMRRRPEYQIATEFWTGVGERFVVKRAGDSGIDFIATIEARERAAESFFGPKAWAVSGVRAANCLVYEHVSGESLEGRVGRALDEGRRDAGAEWIKEYGAFLDDLPTERIKPIEFFRYVRVKSSRNAGGEYRCFTGGPVDLIPSNIIVGADGWRVCDNEFFLDFPIPSDLVRYRGYATLASRVQSQIVNGKARWGLVPFSGGGRRTTYIPATWVDVWQPTEISLRDLAHWSWRFEATILKCSAPCYIKGELLRLNGEKESRARSLARWGGWVLAQTRYKITNALL